MSVADSLMFHQLSVARDMQNKGQLKKARDTYLSVLKMIGEKEKDMKAKEQERDGAKNSAAAQNLATARQVAHQQLGVLYLFNRKYDDACEHLESAIKICTTPSPSNTELLSSIGRTPQPDLSQLDALVGQCYFGLTDYDEAQTHFDRAIKLLTPKGDKPKDKKLVAQVQDLRVWQARCLYRGNHSDRARSIKIFEEIIHENEHHIAALTYYAQIAIECGNRGETLPYLLRALVGCQAAASHLPPKGADSYDRAIMMEGKQKQISDETGVDPQLCELVQVLMTDIVCMPGGVATLLKELHQAKSSHTALSFIAQTIKEQGGVTQSIELYKRAYEVCERDVKTRSHCLLNLVHTMEVDYQYQAAFDLIKEFMKQNGDYSIESKLLVSDFFKAIENIHDVYDVKLRLGEAPGVPAYTKIGPIFDEGKCHVSVPTPGSPPPKKSPSNPYSEENLNMLAIMFTAAKMLYVCGGLQVLPTLINLLEPLRVDRDLHLTPIRNEHAYYSSLAQMMRDIPFPLPHTLAHAPLEDSIYVCGDSHCMSAAWQVIKVDAHPRPMLLVPRLVTGLKVWHLRPSCRFFPKRNFEAAMRHIPSRANVIFNFGEIDCREGILRAVEKGKYETLEDGIRMAVDVYIRALLEQVEKKELTAYIHPTVPVLDVTRKTVKAFTAYLQERVQSFSSSSSSSSSSSASSKPRLIWLDFFNQLLTGDGEGFNMQFHLDSTHLKPTYVHAVLLPALNRVFRPLKGLGRSSGNTAASQHQSTADAIERKLRQAQLEHEEQDIDVDEMD